MPAQEVHVHLAPELVSPDQLAGGAVAVVDVLRATTTIVHALAAGCADVRPCATVEEARALAASLPAGTALLGGERDGRPLPGFDLGNSPAEYTPQRCRGRTLVLTTSNGTRAILHATQARHILVAAFVNLGAVAERLLALACPVHILCAGDGGAVALEDVLLAGALLDQLSRRGEFALEDVGLLALSAFERHRGDLRRALSLGGGGARLRDLGYDDDIEAAAAVDAFALAPEVLRHPLRAVAGAAGSNP